MPVAELRRDVYLDRQPGERLHEILPDKGRVPGGPARHEAETAEPCEVSIFEPELRDVDRMVVRVRPLSQSVSDDVGLLEDLLEHEIGIARLLGSLGVT